MHFVFEPSSPSRVDFATRRCSRFSFFFFILPASFCTFPMLDCGHMDSVTDLALFTPTVLEHDDTSPRNIDDVLRASLALRRRTTLSRGLWAAFAARWRARYGVCVLALAATHYLVLYKNERASQEVGPHSKQEARPGRRATRDMNNRRFLPSDSIPRHSSCMAAYRSEARRGGRGEPRRRSCARAHLVSLSLFLSSLHSVSLHSMA